MKRLFVLILTLSLFAVPAFAQVDGTVSMTESVKSAVKQHPQIKSLLSNRDAVGKNLDSAFGRFLPTLNLRSNVGLQNYDSSSTRAAGRGSDSTAASDSSLTLTQNIFDGMERISGYDREKARLESAEARLYDTVEAVALDAVRAHINVVRERKLQELAAQNIKDHQDVLDNIAERVAAGAGNKADELQARGRSARAQTTFITYTGDLETAEAEYFRVVGMEAEALAPAEFKFELAPVTVEDVLTPALDHNPKIIRNKADVVVAEENSDVVLARMYPDVDLELSSRYTDDLDGSRTYLQDNRAMVGVSWNLFNGGQDYYDRKAADDRINEAQANLKDVTDDLTRQVKNAWTDYQTASREIVLHEEALAYSIESRDMYLMQFSVGQRSLLDVLDAINEVFTNSIQLETAKSNQTFNLYKFFALKGELIKTLDLAEVNKEMEMQ